MRRMFMAGGRLMMELGGGNTRPPVPERFFAALRMTTYCYGHDNTAMTTTKGR
jgi:hypothetical protein